MLEPVSGDCASRSLEFDPPTSTVVSKSPDLDIATLDKRKWISVEPGLVLGPDVTESARPDASARGFGNTAYRSETGEIIYYEGIQRALNLRDFYADAVASWNISKNKLMIEKVTNWKDNLRGDGSLQDDYDTDPTPSSRHVYDAFAYIPGRDQVMLILGASGRLINETEDEKIRQAWQRDMLSTWLYNFDARCWDQNVDDNIRQFWPDWSEFSAYDAHVRYWPSQQVMLVLDSQGEHYAHYDPTNGEWERLQLENAPPDDLNLRGVRSTWDSARGRWVFRSGPHLFYFDPSERRFESLPDLPSDLSDNNITYLSRGPAGVIDRYLMVGAKARDTYVFDPNSHTWTAIDGGTADFGADSSGYIEFDPTTGLVGLVIAGGSGFHVFKY